jgi:hypothetical protein
MVTLIHNDDSWKWYLCGSESPAQLGTKITATCHVTASQDDEPGSWAMRISPRCYNRLIFNKEQLKVHFITRSVILLYYKTISGKMNKTVPKPDRKWKLKSMCLRCLVRSTYTPAAHNKDRLAYIQGWTSVKLSLIDGQMLILVNIMW